MTHLRGLTWAHTRGLAPLTALAQVWTDQHPGYTISWDARSLRSFAEDPLDQFNADYDLIVFDYPFAGEALRAGWLTPLETLLPEDVLSARRAACVGRTYDSFVWNGRLAALPIDAATQVSVARHDLLETLLEPAPGSWDETVSLAERTQTVAMPLTPTAVWGALITLCAQAGEPPLQIGDPVAFRRDTALENLERLRSLASVLEPVCFQSSPVAILNRMMQTDTVAFCPLTYGYSIYAMPGYGSSVLRFGDIAIDHGRPPGGAILGGAGIGVSSLSPHPALAAEMAAWLSSDLIQATLYAQFGGQPAARAAWEDEVQDRRAGGFYSATRRSMDGCFHRPNMPGFHSYQTASANALQGLVRNGGNAGAVLDVIDKEWRHLTGSAAML